MAHVTHHETRRNEVRVKVTQFRDAHGASLGRTAESDCLCYGLPFRTTPPKIVRIECKVRI